MAGTLRRMAAAMSLDPHRVWLLRHAKELDADAARLEAEAEELAEEA